MRNINALTKLFSVKNKYRDGAEKKKQALIDNNFENLPFLAKNYTQFGKPEIEEE